MEGFSVKDWEYNELFDAIHEDYIDYVNLDRGYRYAIARLVDEYWNLGRVEDVVVFTAIGEILITHNKVFVGNVERITEYLGKFNFQDAADELTRDEIEDLSNRIIKVLEGIKQVEIDYNPSAERNAK